MRLGKNIQMRKEKWTKQVDSWNHWYSCKIGMKLKLINEFKNRCRNGIWNDYCEKKIHFEKILIWKKFGEKIEFEKKVKKKF